MRNNDERKAYIDNDENWQPHAITDFTTTERLPYKGEDWYRVMVIEYGHSYDYKSGRTVKRVSKTRVGGYYRINEEQCALEAINGKTEILARMKELDRMCPDEEVES